MAYGIRDTMNGNWSQLEMTTRLGASATQVSLALAAFWRMVTVGRVLFGLIDRWLAERITYHILPFVLTGTRRAVIARRRAEIRAAPGAATAVGVEPRWQVTGRYWVWTIMSWLLLLSRKKNSSGTVPSPPISSASTSTPLPCSSA